MPALLTKISSLPNREVTSSAALAQSTSLVTSNLTKKHSPPAAATSAAVLRPSSSRMSPMTSLAPSRAKNLGDGGADASGPAADQSYFVLESHVSLS